MKKRMILTLVIAMMIFSACPVAFASSSTPSIGNEGNLIYSDEDVSLRSGHEVRRKEFVRTTGGTEYNQDNTRKVIWTEDHYELYYVNVATGSRRFAYDQYEWSWDGYEKQNGSWVYIESKSGTTRTHFELPW